MVQNVFKTLMTLVLLTAAHACNKMPNNGYPIYMRINEVEMVAGQAQFGNTHAITDIWAEANVDNLGAYEYPVEFPVLQEGTVRFLFQAGIKANGFANARVVYPFYAVDTLTVQAKGLDKFTYKPVFRYRPNVKFAFGEDFEFGNQFDIYMDKVSDADVAYGNSCGKLQLGVSQQEKETRITAGPVIQGGGEVWAEFDYKCDASMEVGVYAGPYLYSKVVLFPRQTWNKLYLNLSQEVGYNSGSNFSLYFKIKKPEGSTTANAWVDNVKILTF